MNRNDLLSGAWSLGIVGLFLAASFYGYSPFADGRRVPGVVGVYGPSHK